MAWGLGFAVLADDLCLFLHEMVKVTFISIVHLKEPKPKCFTGRKKEKKTLKTETITRC